MDSYKKHNNQENEQKKHQDIELENIQKDVLENEHENEQKKYQEIESESNPEDVIERIQKMSKRFGETFDDLYSMKEQMDKLFRTSLERMGSEGEHEPGQWYPPVDMYDDGSAYVLEIEIPGVRQQDIEVLLLPDAIRLKGKRDFLSNVEQEKVFRLERPSGTFDRQFRFPGKVDTEHVQATLADGILTLRVPKADSRRKKTVTIEKAVVDHGGSCSTQE